MSFRDAVLIKLHDSCVKSTVELERQRISLSVIGGTCYPAYCNVVLSLPYTESRYNSRNVVYVKSHSVPLAARLLSSSFQLEFPKRRLCLISRSRQCSTSCGSVPLAARLLPSRFLLANGLYRPLALQSCARFLPTAC
jgi:hypothetical protein